MTDWGSISSLTREEIKRILAYKKNIAYIIFFIAFEIIAPLLALQQTVQEYISQQILPPPTLFQSYTKFFAYAYVISLGIFIAYGVSIDNFISDKRDKVIETMLAAPLPLGRMLLVKTLAIFILSYFSMVFAFIFFVVISNFLFIGHLIYVPEVQIWIALFAIYPFTCFSAIALIGIGLLTIRRATIVNLIAFAVAFLLMVLPSLFTTDFLKASTSTLTLTYMEATIFLAIVTSICKRLLLKKERVVLSARDLKKPQ